MRKLSCPKTEISAPAKRISIRKEEIEVMSHVQQLFLFKLQ